MNIEITKQTNSSHNPTSINIETIKEIHPEFEEFVVESYDISGNQTKENVTPILRSPKVSSTINQN